MAKWKLVRDNIPTIANSQDVKILDDKTYRKELTKKLDEEIKELKAAIASDNSEDIQTELTDVMEVLACIVKDRNFNTEVLFAVADKKRKERGSFVERKYMKIEKE